MKNQIELLTGKVIGCAIEVHRNLGPGLLESVYQICLTEELAMAGIQARKQVPIPINYKGQQLDKEFVADFIIEDTLVVEIKAVEIILPVHEVQLVTYLKLAEKNIGLLINFNVPVLTAGSRRKVHDLQEN